MGKKGRLRKTWSNTSWEWCVPTNGWRTTPISCGATHHRICFQQVCMHRFHVNRISKWSLIHVVDMNTKYSGACFLSEESSRDIWDAFVKIFVDAIVDCDYLIVVDQGPHFTSDESATILLTHGIAMRQSGVKKPLAIPSALRSVIIPSSVIHIKNYDSSLWHNTIIGSLNFSSCP